MSRWLLTTALCVPIKDLPQPLLWPQLQVSEGEKSYTFAHQFSFIRTKMIGFQVVLGRRKIMSNELFPEWQYVAGETQRSGGFCPVKPLLKLNGRSSKRFVTALIPSVIRLITGYHKVRKGDAVIDARTGLVQEEARR